MKNMALFQKLLWYVYFLFIFYYQHAKFQKNRREKKFWALRPPLKKLRPKEMIPVSYLKKYDLSRGARRFWCYAAFWGFLGPFGGVLGPNLLRPLQIKKWVPFLISTFFSDSYDILHPYVDAVWTL